MTGNIGEMEREALAYCSERLFSDAGARALSYLTHDRGISPAVLADFHVGLYEADHLFRHLVKAGFDRDLILRGGLIRRTFQHALVFPWLMPDRRIGGLVFRMLPYIQDVPVDRFDRKMRYAFAGNRDAVGLYGLEQAIAAGHRELLIVEGTVSLLVLRSHGITDVVAANSCQIRVWHARDLKHRGIRTVTLCLDGDSPGRRGTLRSIEACMAVELPVRIGKPLPGDCDPDDVVRLHGAPAFRRLVDDSTCGLEFMARRILDGSSEARPNVTPLPPSRDEALRRAAAFCALRAPHLPTRDLDVHVWSVMRSALGFSATEVKAALQAEVQRRIEERGHLLARAAPT